MYSSIYTLQSSTQRLPIQAVFGFTLKQSSPICSSSPQSSCVLVLGLLALGHLTLLLKDTTRYIPNDHYHQKQLIYMKVELVTS